MSASEGRASILRSAAYPLTLFISVVLLGVGGFVALAEISVLEAAFWVVDPTSVEIHFQEHGSESAERASKFLSIVVRVLIVVSGAWVAESVLSTAFGGSITRELRKVQSKKDIQGMSEHIVVCGYGMFGRTVANRLEEGSERVVVVELEDEEYERSMEDGHATVKGDCRREEVLMDAGVERARAVIGCVDDSNVNIQSAVVASQISPDCKVVVRVGDEMYESLARRAGADDVVIPEVITGESVTDRL